MGSAESTEKLGQRVVIAKAKLDRDLKSATERYEYLKLRSPQTLQTMIESTSDSFATCSPFLESTLLIAWLFDAEKCQNIVLRACKKVLREPINKHEYEWFNAYIFSSNIWMMKIEKEDKFMYEELLRIGNATSSDIVTTMDSIYKHLTLHPHWDKVLAIKNQTLIPRQDDNAVGLLKEKGLSNIFDNQDNKSDDSEQSAEMRNFVDSNMAINMLTSTASKINDEFLRFIKLLMSSHGDFKAAPMKKVERSLSKCENDYANETFPKAAKLLDLVRCSVTFNTVEQLLKGYEAFMTDIKAHPSHIELARVKNGFINSDDRASSGYRDIKINVLFKSQDPQHRNVRMICEVQFLLINYLQEKRRIHKLYSILREETFFKMVVSDQTDKKMVMTQTLDVGRELKTLNFRDKHHTALKSSVDSEFGLLGIEAPEWFGVVDLATKKKIWDLKRETRYDYAKNIGYGHQTHQWLMIEHDKYVSVQTARNEIKMFKVVKGQDNTFEFVEDPKYRLLYSNGTSDDATISFCDFDSDSQNIFLITDYRILQKRAVQDIGTVLCSIELQERVSCSMFRNFRLSADGRYCVLGGGLDKKYFYVVDIASQTQHKLTSKILNSSYVPVFVNGENQFIAVGDKNGRIEIWDFEKKQSVKILRTRRSGWITASSSTQNVLAVGSRDDKLLTLYDVRTWQCFYEKKFECQGWSLHLTEDLKFVTFAGYGFPFCVVLEIIR